MITNGGFQTSVSGAGQVRQKTLVGVLLGLVAAIMAAFTDNGKFHRFFAATAIWSSGTAKKITATVTGNAPDVKAIQVILTGTDTNGDPLTESMPAFTVNTLGSVTSVGLFKTLTSIEIPAHDGTGAITSIGVLGAGAADVLAGFTDIGVNAVFKTATIHQPDVPRNITATAGGTAADVKAIQPIVRGLNEDEVAISETLPAFTVNTNGDVVGSKAFASITTIDLPVHDGTGATTSFGTGAKLGIGRKMIRNTVLSGYLADVREATAPTVVNSSSALESNTFALNSALNATDVTIYFLDDEGD